MCIHFLGHTVFPWQFSSSTRWTIGLQTYVSSSVLLVRGGSVSGGVAATSRKGLLALNPCSRTRRHTHLGCIVVSHHDCKKMLLLSGCAVSISNPHVFLWQNAPFHDQLQLVEDQLRETEAQWKEKNLQMQLRYQENERKVPPFPPLLSLDRSSLGVGSIRELEDGGGRFFA
mgnify:CR=1 FL=1